MKKYAGHKTVEQIREQCAAAGVELDTSKHDDEGMDCIVLRSAAPDGTGKAQVLFNTVNGNFFGTTPEEVGFTSENTVNDGEPWFQALLEFFYVPLPADAADSAPGAPQQNVETL